MTLTIEFTPEQQAALEAQASAYGLELPEFVKLRLLDKVPPSKTWGASIIDQWKQSGVIGAYGDMSKDSPEYARELRARLEEELFPETSDAA